MNELREDIDMVLTMQDRELTEWHRVDLIELYKDYMEDEDDEAMRRWRLFTCFLLDTDEGGCLV